MSSTADNASTTDAAKPREAQRLWQPLTLALNHGLQQSSSARNLAELLEGHCLDVVVSDTAIALRLAVRSGRWCVEAVDDTAASARLTGPPLALIRLLSGEAQALIRQGEVQLRGDTEMATRFQALLRLCRPDAEELLSRVVGDVAARPLWSLAQGVLQWGRHSAGALTRSLGEYLTEERGTLPTRTEVEEFYTAVDELAAATDRAAARLAEFRRSLSP
jgi:ubiquinone biosynthesis accessory factor UbiJ